MKVILATLAAAAALTLIVSMAVRLDSIDTKLRHLETTCGCGCDCREPGRPVRPAVPSLPRRRDGALGDLSPERN